MKARPVLLALTAVALLAAAPVRAQNYQFLQYTPAFYFTDADWKLFEGAIAGALNDRPVGTPVEWNNPATGASGSVKVLKAVDDREGLPCREVEVASQARKINNRSVQTMCRVADGTWKIAN